MVGKVCNIDKAKVKLVKIWHASPNQSLSWNSKSISITNEVK